MVQTDRQKSCYKLINVNKLKINFSIKSTDTLERIGAKLEQSYQHQDSRGYQLQNKMEQTSDFESESSDFGSGSSGKILFLFISLVPKVLFDLLA